MKQLINSGRNLPMRFYKVIAKDIVYTDAIPSQIAVITLTRKEVLMVKSNRFILVNEYPAELLDKLRELFGEDFFAEWNENGMSKILGLDGDPRMMMGSVKK